MSDSVMAPVAAWTMLILTLSELRAGRSPARTSTLPWTSALRTMASSLTWPSSIFLKRSSRVIRSALTGSSFRTLDRRYSAMSLAVSRLSTTWKDSRPTGTSEKPRTSTGTDGPAFLIGFPTSSYRARTFPAEVPGDEGLAAARVPCWTMTVARGPFWASRRASRTTPWAGTLGIGLELDDVGHEEDHLQEVVDVLSVLGRDLDADDLAAPVFDEETFLGQLLLDPVGVGLGLVDLVDGHDDRDAGGLGVVDGFLGLGHHPVVGGDDQDDDVRQLGAAGPELGEGLVARRVDERDRPVLVEDAVGADVLGDAAGFLVHEVRGADGVEERRLAVVDVAHDGHDGRPRNEIGRAALGPELRFLFDGEEFDVDAGGPGQGFGVDVVHEVVGRQGQAPFPELVEEVLELHLHPFGDVLDAAALPAGRASAGASGPAWGPVLPP